MAERRRPKPYRQGTLDSLCGIYAIINAIRCVQGDRHTRLKGRELFAMVLRHAERQIPLAQLITEGIEPTPLWRTAKAAIREFNATHGASIKVDRPYLKTPPMSIEALHAAFAEEFKTTPHVFIVSLEGKYDHWTVVYRVTGRSFMLCDSDGLHRLGSDQCTTDADKLKNHHQIHLIRTTFTIQLRNDFKLQNSSLKYCLPESI